MLAGSFVYIQSRFCYLWTNIVKMTDTSNFYQADSDSGGELDYQSDDSWSSYRVNESDSDSNEPEEDPERPGPSRPVTRGGSTVRGRGKRGRGQGGGRGPPTADDYNWEVLDADEEFELSQEWLPEYTQRKGVLVDTSNFEVLDYFKLFFPDALLAHIVDETNRYGDEIFEQKVTAAGDGNTPDRIKRWKHVDVTEISAFIGLQISMGLCSKPAFTDYWSTAPWLTYTPFTRVMGRNRYELIHGFLHFCNNADRVDRNQPEYDPLFKVRPLLDITAPLYPQAYGPGRELSIDESMVAFKGRIFFKQYLPSKPTKWGLKVFMLSDSVSYYCLKPLIYTGKAHFVVEEGNNMRSQVVLNLMSGFENHGHILYTDNFYTSPHLYTKLKEQGIGACGTVLETSRGYPTKLKKKELKLRKGGQPVFAKSDNLLVSAFHDSKRVSVIATIGDNSTIIKRVRDREVQGHHRVVQKPSLADSYNTFMGGVDHFDQLKGNYCYPHRSLKWYQTVYHFVIETALINGLICYRDDKDPSMTAKKFRQMIVDSLIKDQVARRNRTAIAPMPVAQNRLAGQGFLHFPRTYENKKYKPDCIVCKSVGKRAQTRHFCPQCNVPLCLEFCFETYHTVDDYAVVRRRRLQQQQAN